MIIKKRERTLALITLALLVLVLAHYAYKAVAGPRSALSQRLDAVRADVERKQNRLNAADLAEARLERARKRSLPADKRLAQSLYQQWLNDLASDAKFSKPRVEVKGSQSKKSYDLHRFSINTSASLESLTEFLYHFYDAGHLHQITSLSIKPNPKNSSLKLTMTVEALSLKGAESTGPLSKEASRHDLPKLKEYQKSIVDRNIFAAYKPPPPPAPPAPPAPPPPPPSAPSFDAFQHVKVTGITAGEKPMIWIREQTSGIEHTLFEGQEAQIQGVTCKILHIDVDHLTAEIELDGQRCLAAWGESLRDVKVLEEKPKNTPSAEDKSSKDAKPDDKERPKEEEKSEAKVETDEDKKSDEEDAKAEPPPKTEEPADEEAPVESETAPEEEPPIENPFSEPTGTPGNPSAPASGEVPPLLPAPQ
jgi:hypothetical protein